MLTIAATRHAAAQWRSRAPAAVVRNPLPTPGTLVVRQQLRHQTSSAAARTSAPGMQAAADPQRRSPWRRPAGSNSVWSRRVTQRVVCGGVDWDDAYLRGRRSIHVGATRLAAPASTTSDDGAGDSSAATVASKGDADEKPPEKRPLPKGMARQVAILTGSQFIITAGFGLIVPILPMFATELGLGAAGVGAVLSAPAAMRVLLNLPMGAMADRIGRKPLMVMGTLASAIGGIGTAFAGSMITMLPFRALVGAGSAASMAGSSAYMADLTARAIEHRAKLLGVQQTLIALAFITGPAIGGFLAELYGPRMPFVIVGVTAGICSLGYSLLPETLRKEAASVPSPLSGAAPRREASDNTGAAAVASDAAATAADGVAETASSTDSANPDAAAGSSDEETKPPGALETWLTLLKNPTQQAIVTMQGVLATVYSCQLAVVPLHAADILGSTPGQLGLMFSAVSMMGLAGAPLGGFAADKFGRKKVIVPAALLCSIAPLSLAFATTQPVFIASMCCMGLGTSLMNPGLTAFAADIAPPEHRGQALSLGRQSADVMFAVAPIGLGMLAQYVNNSGALMLTSGIVLGAAGMFAARAREVSKSALT